MATGTEVVDIGRRDHVILFYRDEKELTDRVGEYLLPAIQDGGVAIVVATPDHRRSFERHLADAGVDVAAACARGAYLAPDASETMRGFMVADLPDPAGFWQAISPLLRQAAQAGQQVRVFGEMVSLPARCPDRGVPRPYARHRRLARGRITPARSWPVRSEGPGGLGEAIWERFC